MGVVWVGVGGVWVGYGWVGVWVGGGMGGVWDHGWVGVYVKFLNISTASYILNFND